jgi:hypothetical protein
MQFIHLDPVPATQINADPCRFGSETLVLTSVSVLYFHHRCYYMYPEVGSTIFLGGALSLECYLFFDVR